MSFSEESISKLADVTARDIFDKIEADGRFCDIVMNSMPDAIRDVIGDASPELIGLLGCEIMGRIGIIEENDPYSNNNMRRTSSSSHNLCQYDHYSKDFECHRIGLSPNIENSLQTRLHCEACRVKLFHNRQRYFAFDKEYCPNCWRTISYKIVNNYP